MKKFPSTLQPFAREKTSQIRIEVSQQTADEFHCLSTRAKAAGFSLDLRPAIEKEIAKAANALSSLSAAEKVAEPAIDEGGAA